MPKIVKLVDIC